VGKALLAQLPDSEVAISCSGASRLTNAAIKEEVPLLKRTAGGLLDSMVVEAAARPTTRVVARAFGEHVGPDDQSF
jgi:hypothetical protein